MKNQKTIFLFINFFLITLSLFAPTHVNQLRSIAFIRNDTGVVMPPNYDASLENDEQYHALMNTYVRRAYEASYILNHAEKFKKNLYEKVKNFIQERDMRVFFSRLRARRIKNPKGSVVEMANDILARQNSYFVNEVNRTKISSLAALENALASLLQSYRAVKYYGNIPVDMISVDECIMQWQNNFQKATNYINVSAQDVIFESKEVMREDLLGMLNCDFERIILSANGKIFKLERDLKTAKEEFLSTIKSEEFCQNFSARCIANPEEEPYAIARICIEEEKAKFRVAAQKLVSASFSELDRIQWRFERSFDDKEGQEDLRDELLTYIRFRFYALRTEQNNLIAEPMNKSDDHDLENIHFLMNYYDTHQPT